MLSYMLDALVFSSRKAEASGESRKSVRGFCDKRQRASFFYFIEKRKRFPAKSQDAGIRDALRSAADPKEQVKQGPRWILVRVISFVFRRSQNWTNPRYSFSLFFILAAISGEISRNSP